MLEWSKRTARSRLIIHTSRLQFYVLTIGICKQIFPNATIARKSPKEYLHTKFLVVIGMMDRAKIFIVPISAIEIIVFTHYVI